jgi:hypothetical protein
VKKMTQMPDEQYPEENNITDEDEGNASPL